MELDLANLSPAEVTARFDEIQAAIQALPQATLNYRHTFGPGVYAREMSAPQGALIVGKIHATANLFILWAGTITVWDAENGVRQLTAPHIEWGKVGVRRLGLCKTDVVWTNYFPTTETDLATLEKTLEIPHEVAGLSDVKP
jgi:hypothetical protein